MHGGSYRIHLSLHNETKVAHGNRRDKVSQQLAAHREHTIYENNVSTVRSAKNAITVDQLETRAQALTP